MADFIKENVQRILREIPAGVELVAAAKTRSPGEIQKAVEAGIRIVGENYVQEAEEAYKIIGSRVKWHFIGHLQRNKVKPALEIFDMIETLDRMSLAKEIEKRAAAGGKVVPVLIEINSGREERKFGVFPEDVVDFVEEISKMRHIHVQGLMTMGPMFGDPEDARPYFVETRTLFERLKKMDFPNVEMRRLSMGMTNSYRVAIEEGANIIRIGTKIFGPREE
ncbi:MAG: YggS family pyridoxal phosphate-dependent enzyme [Candidatus Aminicenantes bacterium]